MRRGERVRRAPIAAVRRERRAEGLADLQRWLCDVVRSGLASAAVTDASFWDSRARRLIDAQLPGLARRLSRCYEHAIRRSDWPEAVLREFGLLQLAISASAKYATMGKAKDMVAITAKIAF